MKIIYSPVATEEDALQLASQIIEYNLAGCCQISSPKKSIYMWEGKIENATEHGLIIKTSLSKAPELTKWLEEHHPYDTPCIIEIDAQSNPGYQSWLDAVL